MKKLPPTIKDELQQLRAHQADPAWKESTKQALLAELNLSFQSEKQSSLPIIGVLASYLKDGLRQMSLKPIGVFVLIAAVIMGPGLVTVSAARASLPGDALYGIKRGLEKAEVAITFNPVKKAKAEIYQVGNRLDELQRIAQENAPTPKRQEQMVLALKELKKGTDTVKVRLGTVKLAGNEKPSEEKTDIARAIEDEASDLTSTLQVVTSSLEGDSVGNVDEIGEALAEVQGVALDALVILAENQQQGDESITDEELHDRLKDHIDNVKGKASDLSKKINDIEDAEAGGTVEEALSEEEEDAPEEAEAAKDESEDTEENVEEEEVEDEEDVIEGEEEESSSDEESNAVEEEPTGNLSGAKEALDGDVQVKIEYVEELLEMEQFKAALDTLTTTKNTVDGISNDINLIDGILENTEETVDESIEEEPAEDQSGESTEDGQNESESEDTSTENTVSTEIEQIEE